MIWLGDGSRRRQALAGTEGGESVVRYVGAEAKMKGHTRRAGDSKGRVSSHD